MWLMQATAGEWEEGFDSSHIKGDTPQDERNAESEGGGGLSIKDCSDQ